MKKYARYITTEYFVAYVRVVVVVSLIVIMAQLINSLKNLPQTSGIIISDIMTLGINLMPYVLYQFSPFAIAVSVAITFLNLSRSLEITILKNARLSNFSIAKSALLFNIYVAIAMFSISFFILPFSFKIIQTEYTNISQKYTTQAIQANKIIQLAAGTILIENLRDGENTDMVFIHKEENETETDITAKSSKIWLNNANIGLDMSSAILESYDDKSHTVAKFKNFETQIDMLADAKSENQNGLQTLNIIELFRKFFSATIDDRPQYIAEIALRINMPLLNIALPTILTSVILTSYRPRRGISNIKWILTVMSAIYTTYSYHTFPQIFNTDKTFLLNYINILLTLIIPLFFLLKPN